MRIRRNTNAEDIESFLQEQSKIIERLPVSGHSDILGRRVSEPMEDIIRARIDFFDIYELALESDREMKNFERLRISWTKIKIAI